MKKVLFAFLLIPIIGISQKVKVKKETVYIDKVEVGTVTKSKDSLGKHFTYADKDGNILAINSYKFVASPIEGKDDDGYYFYQLVFPEYDLTYGLDFDEKPLKFNSQTRKSFVKSLVKRKYVDASGKVIEANVRDKFTGPAIPPLVSAYLEVEEKQKENLDFIAERDLSKSVYIRKAGSKKESKQFLDIGYNYFFFDDYKIYQGVTQIGLIKVRYRAQQQLGRDPSSSGMVRSSDPKIYILNNKGGRVAWSHGIFHDLKIHKKNIRLDQRKAKFLNEDNISKRLQSIAEYLVSWEYL